MSALGKVVRAGVGRRRVQAAVITLSLLMAVTAALVAGTMLAVSAGPFDRAFARQHGAQLTAEFDESKVTGAQLAASAQASGAGVTATAGPFQEATITPPGPPGLPGMPLTVVGRASASGPVDRVDLLWGHWPTRADEIVLAQDQIGSLYSHETDLPIATSSIGGSAKSIGVAAGSMRLRVVGVASSVSLTAGGWVLPEEIAALRAVDPTRSPATSQMLYRFQRADSSAELSHDQVAVAASVPRDALVGSRSWLDTKLDADQNAAVVVPIIGAFGVLGLAMSVVIVAAVVSGAVGTSTRRIGVLKSLGFSPEQVVRAYVTQALVPAAVGAGLGLVLGNIAVQPLLGEAQQGFQVGALTVPWWLDAVVPGAALGVVVLAALVPALRAGRLSTVAALAVGRGGAGAVSGGAGPGAGSGGHARRRRQAQEAVGRLPLPRPVSLGVASALAHPVRAAGMLTAVLLGTVTATFALGLTSSAGVIGHDRHPESRAAVTVEAAVQGASGIGALGATGSGQGAGQGSGGPGSGGPLVSGPLKGEAGRSAVQIVRTATGTGSWYAVTAASVAVEGKSGAVGVNLFQGDSRKAAYDIISGRWFTAPGEVVAPSRFLASTGTRVGDSIVLVDQGERVRVRIVGEDFDPTGSGMQLAADVRTIPRELASGTVEFVHADPRAGVTVDAYLKQLNGSLQPIGAGAAVNSAGPGGSMVVVIEAMSLLLTLMLLATAGLGILNSVVLDTRERVRDLGICRALGMTPGQTTAQVLVTVAGLGLAGGLAGAPLGIALHHAVMPMVLHAVGSNTPGRVQNVFGGVEVVGLVVGGSLLAMAGGMLPASWAARARTAVILRTE